MARYLYGAKENDSRYLQRFQDQYGQVGEKTLSSLKQKVDDLDRLQLTQIMRKGIAQAKLIERKQAKSYGYNSPEIFAKDYNRLINKFETISFTMLERTVEKIASDLTGEMTKEHALKNIKRQKKIKDAFEKDVNNEISYVWESLSGLIKEDQALNVQMEQLVNLRKKTLVGADSKDKSARKYTSDYAGKLGELSVSLLSQIMDNFFLSTKGKTGESSIIGALGRKGDVKIDELVFSVKNYTAIRNQFRRFSEATKEGKTKKKAAADVSIQSSGSLENVLENFNKTSQLNFLDMNDDFYMFLMNSIYFNQYENYSEGYAAFIEKNYQDSMQILDILVNAFAYTFLIQGTSEKMGYTIEELNNVDSPLPGFMWFVGKGIVPMSQILESVMNNFTEVLTKQRAGGQRRGTYAMLKLSDQKKVASSVDDSHERSLYGDQPTLAGEYYWKSFNTVSYLSNPTEVLSGRYDKFSKNLEAKVRLHLQMRLLEELIFNFK